MRRTTEEKLRGRGEVEVDVCLGLILFGVGGTEGKEGKEVMAAEREG